MDAFGLECGLPRGGKSETEVAIATHTLNIEELRSALLAIQRKITSLNDQVDKVSETSHGVAKQNVQALDLLNEAHLTLAQRNATRLDAFQMQLVELSRRMQKFAVEQSQLQFAEPPIPSERSALQQSAPNNPDMPSPVTADDFAARFMHVLEDLEKEPLESRLNRMQQEFEERIRGISMEVNTPPQALMEAESMRQKQEDVSVKVDDGGKGVATEPLLEFMESAGFQLDTEEDLIASKSKKTTLDEIVLYIDDRIAAMKLQLQDELVHALSSKLQSSAPEEQERANSAPAPALANPGPAPEMCAPDPSSIIRVDIPFGYTLAGSIWDLSWFIGCDEVTHGGSVVIVMLYVLNVVIQVSFCIVCHQNFTESDFSDAAINGLDDFRLASGHDFRFYDNMFGKSLIQHICSNDAQYAQNMMVYAARQLEVINTVNNYIRDDEENGFLALFSGRYMCVLAMICWTLCVQGELQNIWCCLAALIRVPHGPNTVIEGGEAKCLGACRFRFILGIELQQVAICIYLLIYGCIWLSHTSNIQELLLNAAALEFVLSVDEMIYDALAPPPSKAFIENISPLSVSGRTGMNGIDALSIASMIFLSVVVSVFYGNFAGPMVGKMQAAKSALCDQDLEFRYGFDQWNIVWIDRTSTLETTARLRRESQQTVRDVIHNRSTPNSSLALQIPYAHRVKSLDTAAVAGPTTYPDLINPNCGDLASFDDPTLTAQELSEAKAFVYFLRVYTNNFSILDCDDFQRIGGCSIVNHPGIVLCSEKCGCLRPTSAVFSQALARLPSKLHARFYLQGSRGKGASVMHRF